jgi:oxygen-independent coproporphyrinogen-3 oxidase
MSDLGLYVHLPFCRRRCTYCAFAISTDRTMEDAYVRALLAEITGWGTRPTGEESLVSIFYGGGTPSLLEPDHLRGIDAAVRAAFRVSASPEISLEANPEDISAESLAGWQESGVNRLSIGVQSFDDRELYPLGRGHGREAALRAIDLAVQAGGLRVSVDLILGLPGQTLTSFEGSLRTAIGKGAGHLSLYMLDLEEGSALRKHVEIGRTVLPDDGLTAAMYERAVRLCSDEGLAQYEVSNFARSGEECLHNLRYWERNAYVGVGLGAHSFLDSERFANTRDLDDYIRQIDERGDAVVFREALTDAEVREERLLLSLRQSAGLQYADLVALCGLEGRVWAERGIEEGWLQRRGDRVGFTSAGFLLSNDYIAQLF